MNDDLVVQKILKLLENNTAFIGYALNGGIGTKINVRNTETGKTIQALSINVDSTGEVLVVKDSADGLFKAVTFKTAEKVASRIIQLRKTKPVDDKKTIEYTDSDIEVFYLFVKLIDTGVPVPTQLESTWIRKGSSCTQFVGAYERCNYASKATIDGTSYTGFPFKTYSTLNDCLNDDLGRDAKTPHGSKDKNGPNFGWKIYSTKLTSEAEFAIYSALISHDTHYGTNYTKQYGYGSILDCSGTMYIQGWEIVQDSITGEDFFQCDFGQLPGFTLDCNIDMQNAGYCDTRGFVNSKSPPTGSPDTGLINNDWGYDYGWVNLSYDFMYKRHFQPLYTNGDFAKGSFLILEVNEDQSPTIPPGFFPWSIGCPSSGNGGPYDGSGGNRFPEGTSPEEEKRDMKLSTHKAEIWLGSSKKKEAIKLYELGSSDLFSGMYNSLIIKADETQVDLFNRLQRTSEITLENQLQNTKFYENCNKNIIDLNIDPRVWFYTLDNKPKRSDQFFHDILYPQNNTLQLCLDNLYNRTINLSIVDKNTQIVHLKLGLTPKNILSNTDCKGTNEGNTIGGDNFTGQSWEYQKYITIKIENWEVESTTNTLDTSLLTPDVFWNKDYIERKFLTSFGFYGSRLYRELAPKLLLRHDSSVDLNQVTLGSHFEQYNYGVGNLLSTSTGKGSGGVLYISSDSIGKDNNSTDQFRQIGVGTYSWWELWNKTLYNKKTKRLNTIVGYEFNRHQILKSSKLSPSLNYSGFGTSNGSLEDYYEYLPNRPLEYSMSTIKAVRSKLIDEVGKPLLNNRNQLFDDYGLLFFFSDENTGWTDIFLDSNLSVPSSYYALGDDTTNLFSGKSFPKGASSSQYSITPRIDTRRWLHRLWAQLIFTNFINVDVDSYRNVDFNLPTNPSQYIKFATFKLYTNSEYNFTIQPSETTTITSVLSSGILDITKQVKITKPTNVELDPNMSFLVYLYPFVEVTKKKKTI